MKLVNLLTIDDASGIDSYTLTWTGNYYESDETDAQLDLNYYESDAAPAITFSYRVPAGAKTAWDKNCVATNNVDGNNIVSSGY